MQSLLNYIKLNPFVYCTEQDIYLSRKGCFLWLFPLTQTTGSAMEQHHRSLQGFQEVKSMLNWGALTLVLWLRDDLSNHCRSPCNPSCLNNLIPKTLSWMMARQLGHLTGIHISLISHLFALISSGSSWSSSCWSVYRPQPNTRWLAHSSSMSVYAGSQSMHVRTEPHGDKGLGSRETKARAWGSRRCMRRSSRVWGFMMKTTTPQAWWEEEEEEEWTSVSSLISVNPLPARSQGSHPTSTLGTK